MRGLFSNFFFFLLDKGCVLIAAFGLPPLAHDNDAFIGLSAAMKLRAFFLKCEQFCKIFPLSYSR
jgi:hypothetical protein